MASKRLDEYSSATPVNDDKFPFIDVSDTTDNAAGSLKLGTRAALLSGRTTVSNAAYTILATDKYVAQIGTLSAARTFTLPAANAVPAGYELIVADESGTITDANTIVIQRAGSDTVNGGTAITLRLAYNAVRFISDGTSKWTVLGLLRIPTTVYLLVSNNFVPSNPATAEMATISGIETPWLAIDLSNVTQIRAVTRVLVVSGADATLEGRIQYSLNAGSSWSYIDGSAGPAVAMGSSGGRSGSWVTIEAAARTDVLVRAVTVAAAAIQIRVPWFGFQIR